MCLEIEFELNRPLEEYQEIHEADIIWADLKNPTKNPFARTLRIDSEEFKRLVEERIRWELKNKQSIEITCNIEKGMGLDPGDQSIEIWVAHSNKHNAWTFGVKHERITGERVVKNEYFQGIEATSEKRSFVVIIKEEDLQKFVELMKSLMFNPKSYDFDKLREFALKHAVKVIEDIPEWTPVKGKDEE